MPTLVIDSRVGFLVNLGEDGSSLPVFELFTLSSRQSCFEGRIEAVEGTRFQICKDNKNNEIEVSLCHV